MVVNSMSTGKKLNGLFQENFIPKRNLFPVNRKVFYNNLQGFHWVDHYLMNSMVAKEYKKNEN